MPVQHRDELKQLASDFLKTYGYYGKPAVGSDTAIIFSRPTGMGVTDELLVYFHEKGEEQRLDRNLSALGSKYERLPAGDNGRRFFLSNAPLDVESASAVTRNSFKYQVPVFFFDREFSSAREKTPLKNLEEEARKYESERVAQPFLGEGSQSEDLLKHLLTELNNPKGPRITFIVAPAGYGKTVLMSSLYTKLKEQFTEAKSRQRLAMRPLMMLPGHVKRAEDLETLTNNFIGEEYDFGVASSDGFKFWVTQGFAVWLLDGLEELIIKSPEITFQLLDEYIYSSKGKNTQIVVSVRKPLLATSPELREAMNEWKGSGLAIYELADWAEAQKEKYFRKNLAPEADPGQFISQIRRSPTLNTLCNVPYYCNLVAELHNENRLKVINDETELVEYAFERICEREFGKGLEDQIFTVDKQKELFSILAVESAKTRSGFDKDLLFEWAADFLPGELAAELRDSQLSCIGRHAVLSISDNDVDFVHDILKQFLIGRFLFDELRRRMLNEFGWQEIERGSLIHKYLAKGADKCDWENILAQLGTLKPSPQSDNRTFRNVLKVYLSSSEDSKEISIRSLINNTNLNELWFDRLNLKGFSFHNSKLAGAGFVDCDLSNAEFDGCTFKDTFISNSILTGASLADATLESIRLGDRIIFDQKEMTKFFVERTRMPMRGALTPCQGAINLKRMFEKLTRRGKGNKVQANFVANTKIGGGIQAAALMKVAARHGYIAQEDTRVKIKISLFDEALSFVRDSRTASKGIRNILDAICSDTGIGCKHVSPIETARDSTNQYSASSSSGP